MDRYVASVEELHGTHGLLVVGYGESVYCGASKKKTENRWQQSKGKSTLVNDSRISGQLGA